MGIETILITFGLITVVSLVFFLSRDRRDGHDGQH
jgi:hypothetical protein